MEEFDELTAQSWLIPQLTSHWLNAFGMEAGTTQLDKIKNLCVEIDSWIYGGIRAPLFFRVRPVANGEEWSVNVHGRQNYLPDVAR